jgi:hypothetical protein
LSAWPEFVPFGKISRLNRETIVTEKIDGTNASVHVSEGGEVRAASRTRWITPEDDNAGFAKWVHEHAAELQVGLGPGAHFGEWWGSGVQRGYGLPKGEKRFSLFNTWRWADGAVGRGLANERPACCHVVPVLGVIPSLNLGGHLDAMLANLREHGSYAAPGFMRPEGIVIFHVASGALYKVTLEKDAEPKGKAEWLAAAGVAISAQGN